MTSFILFFLPRLRNPWIIIPLIFNRSTIAKIKDFDEGITFRIGNGFGYLGVLYRRGWRVIDVKNNIIYLKNKEINIMGYLIHFRVLCEPLENDYKVFDYKNKTVLDVGGYIGYSSVLFSRWGAKKVIIYEAQKENIPIIKENLKINKVNGEVYNLAVSDKDGEIELTYDRLGTIGFGGGR